MHRDGQRFGERGDIGRHVVRNRERDVLLEDHLLREAAVVAVRIAEQAPAHSGPAMNGSATTRCPFGSVALAVGTVIEDLATELMAEHHRLVGTHEALEAGALQQVGEVMGVVASVQIAAADAADERPHQDLARARRGCGNVFDGKPSVAEDSSTHGLAPASGDPAP